MYNGELYKKSWDGPLLSCVSQKDIPKILAERMGSIQHQPTTQATPILNHMPFVMWGIDLVRKFPKAKGPGIFSRMWHASNLTKYYVEYL
ncbi:hypothetical protein LIER_23580 [Lithospermum erythrorhizon]|uniref:Uncharacterized protein n=1 Tax=Lithospermum erythrorhizon TaxID=34254 RepID=A0AAV3R283_LITER